MIPRGALVLFACLLLVACGGGEESTVPVAGADQLLAPYQTEPYQAFDQALIRSIEEQCATSLSEAFNVQPKLVLADGRGGGRIMLLYGGADGSTGECQIRIDANGNASVDGVGSSSAGEAPPPGPREIFPSSSGSASGEESWSYLHGSVGSEIGGVVIELADGTRITASVGGGQFAAWWPSEAQPARILGYDGAGNLVHDERY